MRRVAPCGSSAQLLSCCVATAVGADAARGLHQQIACPTIQRNAAGVIQRSGARKGRAGFKSAKNGKSASLDGAVCRFEGTFGGTCGSILMPEDCTSQGCNYNLVSCLIAVVHGSHQKNEWSSSSDRQRRPLKGSLHRPHQLTRHIDWLRHLLHTSAQSKPLLKENHAQPITMKLQDEMQSVQAFCLSVEPKQSADNIQQDRALSLIRS